MTEQELLVDCVRRLNASGISYMLTGSMASNFWGIPRTTHDLDFVVQFPPSKAHLLHQAFSPEFFIDEASIKEAFNPPFQFNAIDERSALKVDFWLPVRNEFERAMFGRRLQRQVLGEPTWLATPEDIILHKLIWDKITPSERQKSDAAGVFLVQSSSLDVQYMKDRGKELGIDRILAQILDGTIKPKRT